MLSKKLILLPLLCLLFLSHAQQQENLVPSDDENPTLRPETPSTIPTFTPHKPQEFIPEVTDVAEEYLTRDGRILQGSASYPNLRIATDFQLLTAGTTAWKTYITKQLIPAVVSYLQAALRIKYPATSNIQSSSKTLCGFNTPTSILNGIGNADMVFFINSVTDNTGGWMAATTVCTFSAGVKRPTIVNIGINTYAILTADPITNPLIHDVNINVLVHEFVHGLGMNGLYTNFVDASGNLLTGHIKNVKLAGINRQVLDLPPLTAQLKAFYGCDSIPGLFMENDGTAHIERRFFQWEIMTTGGTVGAKISFVTLGFLEGTGWYAPNYDYAEPYFFGKGEGCGFYADSPVTANFPSEYCTGSGIDCTEVGNGGGYCIFDSYGEVGRVVASQYEFNCENPSSTYYVAYANKGVYGRGLGSKCFSGNLASRGSTIQSTYCLMTNCVGSGLGTTLEVMWGTTKLVCTKKGPMAVSGLTGALNCPDPVQFCSTVGKNYCPRNCTGRGTCSQGKCTCNAGFTGTDCGFTI